MEEHSIGSLTWSSRMLGQLEDRTRRSLIRPRPAAESTGGNEQFPAYFHEGTVALGHSGGLVAHLP